MNLSRRKFIMGILATPAVVRIDSLMRVRGVIIPRVPKWLSAELVWNMGYEVPLDYVAPDHDTMLPQLAGMRVRVAYATRYVGAQRMVQMWTGWEPAISAWSGLRLPDIVAEHHGLPSGTIAPPYAPC